MPAIPTQGCTLKLSIPGSPTQYSLVSQVTGINIAVSAPEIETTDLDSAAFEGFSGVPKTGLTFNVNFDPDNTRMQEVRNAIANRTKIEFQVTLSDATPATASGEGYVTGFNVNADSPNSKVTGSITIMVNKGLAWA